MIQPTKDIPKGENAPDASGTQEETQAHTPGVSSTDMSSEATVIGSVSVKAIQQTEAPERIGDYVILSQLGRGGMGVVYQARHVHLNQHFAIKMLRDHDYSDNQASRFLNEAQVIADLKHPGIVQVHHFAIDQNQPYLVMEYLPQGSLDKKLKTSLYSPRDAAVLVASLADAMQAAHDKKVIHRDLKPHNVLLTEQGQPKITDFGLARRTDIALTREFSYLGTPPYMSPEQARGEQPKVNEQSDIYALGAILYEMLTGRPPFRGSNDIETMRLVCDTEVVPVRTLQPQVPLDLETICLHCLQKDPAHRYPSAHALRRDLQAYLDNQSISVRPLGASAKAWRWCKRNPVVAGLSGSIAALLIIGLTVALSLAYWAFNEQHRANKALSDKEITLSELQIKEKEAMKLAKIAEQQRDRMQFNMRYLVDLSSVGRFLCTKPIRTDFGMNVNIIPLPVAMPVAPQGQMNRSGVREPFQTLLFHNARTGAFYFANASWQDQPVPSYETPQTSSSLFPGRLDLSASSGLPSANSASPSSSSTTSPVSSATTGSTSNVAIAGGIPTMSFPKYLRTLKYSLEVETDTDCYLTVLLVRPQTRQCQVVYPNEFNPSVLIEKNKKHTLLSDARVAMQPNETTAPEFVYVLATTKPWTPVARLNTTTMLASNTNTFMIPLTGQPVPAANATNTLLARQIEALVNRSEIPGTKPPVPNNAADANSSPAPSFIPRPITTLLSEDVHLFHAFPAEVSAPAMPPEPKKMPTKPPA